jgi:catechol 2,3-dioxygenase-like lactoylglutathione lyase family enzyme
MLADCNVIGFVPTADADRARRFYVDILGLAFDSDDQFALVVRSGKTMIRIVRTGDFKPAPFTIFGWETSDIAAEVQSLTAAGVPFKRYGFLAQDDLGIWSAPGGAKVAWFSDPDGNILSLSQH